MEASAPGAVPVSYGVILYRPQILAQVKLASGDNDIPKTVCVALVPDVSIFGGLNWNPEVNKVLVAVGKVRGF
ncbi:MAG: hypothetical protein ACLPVO_00410 [Desulfomonilaceae bacterium]